MKDKYLLTIGCKGYVSKSDPTNITREATLPNGGIITQEDSRFLVSGSQNMIVNDQERVESRAGYELFGVADSDADPIKVEFDWINSSGGELFIRGYDEANGNLEVYLGTVDGTIINAWTLINNGFNDVSPMRLRFTTWWDSTELIDLLLFVSGTFDIYEWSGGVAVVGSVPDGTHVTKAGTTTWAQNRFYTTRDKSMLCVRTGTEYTYTAGEASTNLTVANSTGLLPGDILIQKTVLTTNKPTSTGFTNDVIKTFQNQIFVGSYTSQRLYISSNTSYSTFTFSSPRIAGEGALTTLDATMIGLEVPGIRDTDTENKIIVFCKGNKGYKITFEISPGSTADREVPRVKPLPIAEGQGAQSQELIAKVGQTIVWISNDNQLIDLAQIESADLVNNVAISDPIQPDFTNADFSNGWIKFWRNNILITAPTDGKMFIFNVAKRFWQPPQILGMRALTIFNNLLYGHSNSVSETYQLFTGLNDNTNPISFKAHFAYRNSGERALLKNFNRFFTELYLASNTKVTVSLLFEWLGAKQIQTYELDGAIATFLFTPSVNTSLGVNSLGTNPLGGVISSAEDLPKYRRFKPVTAKDHFEYQVRFESEVDDASFQILASGANVKISENEPVSIIK